MPERVTEVPQKTETASSSAGDMARMDGLNRSHPSLLAKSLPPSDAPAVLAFVGRANRFELQRDFNILGAFQALLHGDQLIEAEHLAALLPNIDLRCRKRIVITQRRDFTQDIQSPEIRLEQQQSIPHQPLDRLIGDAQLGLGRVANVEVLKRPQEPPQVLLAERRRDIQIDGHPCRAVKDCRHSAHNAELNLPIYEPFEERYVFLWPTSPEVHPRPIRRNASSSCCIRSAGVSPRFRSNSRRSIPCSPAARHAGSDALT